MSEYKLKTPKSVETAVAGVYKKIENSVVGAYKKVESGAVGAYKKIEDKFVDTFLEKTEPEQQEKEAKPAEPQV